MKNLKHFFIGLLILAGSNLTAQNWETSGNILNPGDFIGSTNDEFFDVRQNNVRRARFQNVNWPGYNGSPSITNASRMFFGIDGNNNNQAPFSMMHLGFELNNSATLQRPWMNVGTTYGAGRDLMYVGLLQRPLGASGPWSNNIVDAVVAWGDNDNFFLPGAGPDNLRFLFLAPTDQTASPGAAPEGLETMRITPWGNVGIGADFTNDQQPHRRAVVYQRTDSPQFRIAWALDPDPVLGTHADFQVSPLGNIHIRPRTEDNHRTVALGFLPGEQADPINIAQVQTVLDVGGVTRIRELREQSANCLITGVNAPVDNEEDNFLARLDFLEGEDADCHVLGAEGTWVNICELGTDCRWQDIPSSTVSGQIDVFTGVDTGDDCDRGKVSIGAFAEKCKLNVFTQTETDRVESGIISTILDVPAAFFGAPIIVAAVIGTAQGEDIENTYIGVSGAAKPDLNGNGGKYNVGVSGNAMNTEGSSIAVHAVASGSASQNIGVYTQAPAPTAGTSNYALLVNGATGNTLTPIVLSDEQLKTEVTPLENASELLSQLQPKQYFFNHDLDTNLRLNPGANFGFLAQEMQAVLPDLVRSVKLPPQLDSTGFISGTESEYLGIQYGQLIPLLVAALNEQAQLTDELPAIVAAQEEEINALKDLVAAQSEQISAMQDALQQAVATFETAKRSMDDCCTNKPANAPGPGSRGELELNQNYPNPFTSQTRIDFYLPREALIRIEITDSQGRKLETLIEGQFASGEHSTTWDGAKHAPGIYYYSLYADGELLTKKMIKM